MWFFQERTDSGKTAGNYSAEIFKLSAAPASDAILNRSILEAMEVLKETGIEPDQIYTMTFGLKKWKGDFHYFVFVISPEELVSCVITVVVTPCTKCAAHVHNSISEQVVTEQLS